MRSLHPYSTTNQAKKSSKEFLLKSLSVLSIFITTFGTIHAQEPSDLSTYVPYQNTYTYNFPKWYWHFRMEGTFGLFYKRTVSGSYERSGIETHFDNMETTTIDGEDMVFAFEGVYRIRPSFYIGPGTAMGFHSGSSSTRQQFRWDLYARARYELPIGEWISPKLDFISLYATAAAGFIFLGGEKPTGCTYYIKGNGYTLEEIVGFIGESDSYYGHQGYSIVYNAISGVTLTCDLGVEILIDCRHLFELPEEGTRYAIALGYRVKPMPYLSHTLNLDDYKNEIDGIKKYKDHIVIPFEQSIKWTLYQGFELSFRF